MTEDRAMNAESGTSRLGRDEVSSSSVSSPAGPPPLGSLLVPGSRARRGLIWNVALKSVFLVWHADASRGETRSHAVTWHRKVTEQTRARSRDRSLRAGTVPPALESLTAEASDPRVLCEGLPGHS